jgi:hypothetical protein
VTIPHTEARNHRLGARRKRRYPIRKLLAMPERLDRVLLQLASRPEPFTLSWDSREQLLDQARGVEELGGVVTAFERAGASRPITLMPDDEAQLLKLIEAWAKRASISELPAAIWELRCALADDLHDVDELKP